ncbi:MAG: ribose 5-phosphate isomerase B [Candidatus Omnitrophica bacterium]|nr:ribose 5-phosphate isomerase B [Candidatus Omnitrophota bacterium]
MKIAIGCDHGGFKLKSELIKFLKRSNHTVKDFGSFTDESCDYPIFSYEVSKAVSCGRFKRGVLICKTGIGMAIAANKVNGVRAAVIHDLESAVSSREHNDCNVIVFGSRFIKQKKAKEILKAWFKARALKGRHRRRVGQMKKIEMEKRFSGGR